MGPWLKLSMLIMAVAVLIAATNGAFAHDAETYTSFQSSRGADGDRNRSAVRDK